VTSKLFLDRRRGIVGGTIGHTIEHDGDGTDAPAGSAKARRLLFVSQSAATGRR
jgi:hypothetical protein